jgi:hypothetical protein
MNDLIIIPGERPSLQKSAIETIIEIEDKLKEYTAMRDEYRAILMKAMEEKGITDILDEETGLHIHYNEAKKNLENFDKKQFREENPDVYDMYVTFTGKKSAYLTVTHK